MDKNTGKSKAVLEGLLDYIDESGEKELLADIAKGLEVEVEKGKGENEIIVESAVPLNSSQLESVRADVAKRLKVDFPVRNIVNRDLIGGFTVRVNDWFFDSSIKNEVRNFKRLILE